MSKSVNSEIKVEWIQPDDGVFILAPKYDLILNKNNVKIAAFDLDHTIIRPTKGRFSKEVNDYKFLPGRVETINKYFNDGYLVAIFTNGKVKGSKPAADAETLIKINRIVSVINNFEIGTYGRGTYGRETYGRGPFVALSSKDNIFRKPNTGMWDLFLKIYNINPKSISKSLSFYCGDASGLPGSFSDSDKKFAENIGLKFKLPEEIFPDPDLSFIHKNKLMIVMVSMAGAGKTTFYEKYLKPLNYVGIDSDIIKPKTKMLKFTEENLIKGNNVSIQALNAKASDRKIYIDLGKKYNYEVIILYISRNGYDFNKLREHPVPDVVYNIYFKNLEEPSYELDGVEVIEIDRV